MSSRFFTGCIVIFVVLFVSGIGYRVYTDYRTDVELDKHLNADVEFLRNSANVSADRRSLDKDGQSPAKSNVPGSTIGETKRNGKTPQSAVKVRYAKDWPEDMEFRKKKAIFFAASDITTQYIETPDGKIHSVLRPTGHEIKTGTFISSSSLSHARRKVTIDGKTYKVPEGEDVDAYIDKIHLSSMYDVPLEDVGRLIKEGLIPSSPIEAGALFDDDPLLAPIRRNSTVGSGGFEGALTPSEVSPVMGESKSPVPPAHVHHGDGHVHHGKKHTDEPPNTESVETQLREPLSPERFEKAQQLIDQYGTEEGLRRFREMDPEAARQFEQERRPTPAREVPGEVESSTQ